MPASARRPASAIILSAAVGSVALGCAEPALQTRTPASSYAILARDPLTGEYGVAAASHAPLVGMNLEFIEPEVGGVVVLGGPHLEVNETVLIALRDGLEPGRAIAVGLAADPDREARQVLALSPSGSAVFSGKKLERHAAHETGDAFAAAGNRLAGKEVIAAMQESFLSSDGPLADRLLAALAAGRDAGGERNGEHSAALLVVGPGARFATRDRLADLRIDFVAEDAVGALLELRARVDSVYGVVR